MAAYPTLLILRLEGALQSWGENSKWDARDTAALPTKSGIVGLLACALGWERGDARIAALYDTIQIAVRADRPGVRMTDYHTVTGHPLRNALGKPRSPGGDTLVSHRQYLQDASFLVVLQAEEETVRMLEHALRHPVWCVYLGRKSCVPSRPVLEAATNQYADLMDAVLHYPAADRAQYPMQYECEQEQLHLATLHRQDGKPEADSRQFARRRVWRGVIARRENDVSDKD